MPREPTEIKNPGKDPLQPGYRKPRLSTGDKIALIKRLEAGETRAVVAEDLGITRQYISLIWKAYQAHGVSALATSNRLGRKKSRELNDEQAAKLLHLVRTQKPSGLKLSVHLYGDYWCVDTAREWIEQKFHFLASRRYLTELFEGWGLPPLQPNPIELEMYTPEFQAYLNSPIAQQIREREKAQLDQLNREAEERMRLREQAFLDEIRAKSGNAGADFAPHPSATTARSPSARPLHSLRSGKHAKGAAQKAKDRRKRAKQRKR